MKKFLSLTLVFAVFLCCVGINAFAQPTTKLEGDLTEIINERDPDDQIIIAIWLASEGKPIDRMPSWPDGEKAITELKAILAAEKQAFYDAVSKEVEWKLYYAAPCAPLVFLEVKVKDVMTIARMDQVVSIGNHTLSTDLSEPEAGKLESDLTKIINERDPDDQIIIAIWLASEGKPIDRMQSWPDSEKAITELKAILAAEKQAFYDTVSKEVEWKLYYAAPCAPLVFLEVKVKDVMTIARMDQVVSIGNHTLSTDLSEPEAGDLKEMFAWWIGFLRFRPNYDEETFDAYTKYQELYYGDGWTLIYGVYPDNPDPELQQYGIEFGGRIINGIVGASEESVAYPYTVYDKKNEVFHNILEIDADEYDGLTEALAELKIGRPIGDADNDNELTILDATCIQRVLAELQAYDEKTDRYWCGAYDGEWKSFFDYDRDNDITILDATAIQRHLAGLTTEA